MNKEIRFLASASALLAVLAILSLVFAGCNVDGTASDIASPNQSGGVEFIVRNMVQVDTNADGYEYIRTYGFAGGAEYPLIKKINSKDELMAYYEQYRDIYAYGDSDSSRGFAETVEYYNDAFFSNNYLAVVLFVENSGSIRHEVKRVEADGDIVITRLIPPIGTDDLAEWHIIIELKKDFAPAQFTAQFEDKYL